MLFIGYGTSTFHIPDVFSWFELSKYGVNVTKRKSTQFRVFIQWYSKVRDRSDAYTVYNVEAMCCSYV